MKILKVRRGYTTNSSAASEFIPPEALVMPGAAAPGAAAVPAPVAKTPATPVTAKRKPVPVPVKVQAAAPAVAAPPTPTPAPVAAAPTPPMAAQPPAKQPSGWSNSTLLAAFAGFVAAVFVLEKGLRAWFRKRRDDEV